ncbi:unnamed protein product [Sphagnum balticum]
MEGVQRTTGLVTNAYSKQLSDAINTRKQANQLVRSAVGGPKGQSKQDKQQFINKMQTQGAALDTSRLNANDYITAIQASTNLGMSLAMPADVYVKSLNAANAMADFITANPETSVMTPEDLAARAADPNTPASVRQYYQSLSEKGYSVRVTGDVANRSTFRNAVTQTLGGTPSDTTVFNGKVQLFRQLPDGTAIDATGNEMPGYNQVVPESLPGETTHGQMMSVPNEPPVAPTNTSIAEDIGSKAVSVTQAAPATGTAASGSQPPKTPNQKQQGLTSDTPPKNYKGTPSNFAFVDPNPMQFTQLQEGVDSVNGVTQDIRDTYSSIKNAQQLRSSLLADSIDKDIKDPLTQQAANLLVDVKGDAALLEQALQDPAISGNKEWAPVIQHALNLPKGTEAAVKAAQKFFDEAGYVGQQHGFLNELRDSYTPRLYKRTGEPQIRTEVNSSGLKKTTGHAKPRVYDNVIEALQNGASPIPLKISDGVRIYGAEFARILANNKLYNALEDWGLGQKIGTDERVPDDYSRVGTTNFAVPTWLKTGLRSITEPNLLADIQGISNPAKLQGVIKTIDLSFSAFHHLTMLAQTAYQSKFGADFILNWKSTMMVNKDFNNLAIDFVSHNGMVTNKDSYRDVFDHISADKTWLDKFLPTKWAIQASKANSKFLFGTIQSYLKVMDYTIASQKWMADHTKTNEDGTITMPSDAAITRAKRGIANATNAAYGGLNMESLGITPSQIQIMRWFMLAPDWVLSNVKQFQYAASDFGALQKGAPINKSSEGPTQGGPPPEDGQDPNQEKTQYQKGGTNNGYGMAGNRSRSNLITAVIGGYAISAGLNYIFTGHAIWKNPKGHQFDIQLPGSNGKYTTYMSLFRGGVGDLVKAGEFIQEDGFAEGMARYFESKLAPVPRTAIALASNIDYYGRNIVKPTDSWAKKTEEGLSYVATQGIGAVPFGITGIADLYSQAQALKTAGQPGLWNQIKNMKTSDIINFVLTGTGLARPGVSQQAGQYKDAVALSQAEHASATARMQPIFQQVQSMIAAGNTQGAAAITSAMSPADYKIYKDLKTAAKTADTKQTEQDMYQTYLQVQGYIKDGNMAEAQAVTEGLTPEQYKVYAKLKAEFGK